jgi:hypothetical protein
VMNETTKSISDDTNDLTDDRSTVAGRIAAAGGAGLHQQILQLGHDFEKRRQAVRTDRKLNDAYRAEQLAALDAQEEEAFCDAESRETAEAAQAFERRKAEIVGKMRAEHAPASRARDQIETGADQLERHFRSTRDLMALQIEIEVAKSITAPEDLEDSLAELMASGRDDRVRRLGPVILARLQELSAKKGSEALAAFSRATARFGRWKQAHPSLSAQLRELEREEQIAKQNRDRAYATARETFKIGPARYGLRIPR